MRVRGPERAELDRGVMLCGDPAAIPAQQRAAISAIGGEMDRASTSLSGSVDVGLARIA
jgi:hypothetical protein